MLIYYISHVRHAYSTKSILLIENIRLISVASFLGIWLTVAENKCKTVGTMAVQMLITKPEYTLNNVEKTAASSTVDQN